MDAEGAGIGGRDESLHGGRELGGISAFGWYLCYCLISTLLQSGV